MIILLSILALIGLPEGFAAQPTKIPTTPSLITTNAASFSNPPPWLTESMVNRASDKIQDYMEWDIRRVKVEWYFDQETFQTKHPYDKTVVAVSKKEQNTILLGPRVTEKNFAHIFGHELVHIIVYQKFSSPNSRQSDDDSSSSKKAGVAVPQWLEEGLANLISEHDKVNYSELAAWINLPNQSNFNVETLGHPYLEAVDPRFHYQSSTAVAEMLDSKCNGMKDLLRLSIKDGMKGYLSTYCEIPDLNSEFRSWVAKKSK